MVVLGPCAIFPLAPPPLGKQANTGVKISRGDRGDRRRYGRFRPLRQDRCPCPDRCDTATSMVPPPASALSGEYLDGARQGAAATSAILPWLRCGRDNARRRPAAQADEQIDIQQIGTCLVRPNQLSQHWRRLFLLSPTARVPPCEASSYPMDRPSRWQGLHPTSAEVA